jgi:hypothetical protein
MLKEVFSQTGANSRVLETDGDDMIGREHDCFFSAAHAAKDRASPTIWPLELEWRFLCRGRPKRNIVD